MARRGEFLSRWRGVGSVGEGAGLAGLVRWAGSWLVGIAAGTVIFFGQDKLGCVSTYSRISIRKIYI